MSRKIDALIAEHVMGYKNVSYRTERPDIKTYTDWFHSIDCFVPHYSTDIAAALEAAETFDEGFELVRNQIKAYRGSVVYKGTVYRSYSSKTGAMALAKAMLKAKGVDVSAASADKRQGEG